MVGVSKVQQVKVMGGPRLQDKKVI
jgi:hypothetical protein